MRNERMISRNAATAMAMVAYGLNESPKQFGTNAKISKGEAKKCKSCKHFEKCRLSIGVSPMKIACEQHERKKRH